MGFIYCLICPKLEKVIYVGSTTCTLKERLVRHISAAKSGVTTPVGKYIRENKITPIILCMEKYEVGKRKEMRIREAWIISYISSCGHSLLNVYPKNRTKQTY